MGILEKWVVNSPRHARRAIERAEKLLSFANMEGMQDFLEVGCGIGATSKHVAEKYRLSATGVDVDPEQVHRAQQSIGDTPNVHFAEADGANLPFQENSFDIVLSYNVMHHVPNWLDALKEIERVLKPGGYFVYSDLVYPDWSSRISSSRIVNLLGRGYGFPTVRSVNSFMEQNDLYRVHSSSSNNHVLILSQYEAVYQKQD